MIKKQNKRLEDDLNKMKNKYEDEINQLRSSQTQLKNLLFKNGF